MIDNGEKIAYKGHHRNIKLNISYYKMQSDMYVIPLGGYDIVLGI